MKAAAVRSEPRPPATGGDTAIGTGLPTGVDLLGRLEGITAGLGLPDLAARLGDLADFVASDLAFFEAELHALEVPRDQIGAAAGHLLDLGGKRLRPLCVILASRLAGEAPPATVDLGIAVELVHSATLLHDDVVDFGDARRGAPAARTVYGNAASIFGGDWLLIEALRRVERCGMPDLLVNLFDTIEAMIAAEAVQLANRGRLNTGLEDYMRVVEGKTASVFRWAMRAGGRAGNLTPPVIDALDSFGLHLGVAFQAVDDLLDLTGDSERTGKALFTDLREGKMTYPMILGLERDRQLRPVVEAIIERPSSHVVDQDAVERVRESLLASGAAEAGLEFARERSDRACAALRTVPDGRARDALETIARTLVDRDL